MNKTITTFLLSVLILTLLGSCSTSRESASATINPPVNADYSAFSSRYTALLSSYGTWQDVKMPVSVHLDKPVSIGLSGQATMVNGKSIHLSLRLLGFEVAAIYVTRDSIFAFEKRGKRYIAESLSGIIQNYPVTVGNLQSLLLGRPFMPGDRLLTTADADLFSFRNAADKDLPQAWLMSLDATAAVVTWIVNDNKLAATAVAGGLTGDNSLTVTYGNPQQTKAGMVASEAEFTVNAGSRDIQATLEWNLSRASWNTGKTTPWKIPRGYKRISSRDIMSLLRGL